MPDKIYSITEARAHLSELAEKAVNGEVLIITRHAKPIARLSPASCARKPIDTQRLRKLTEQLPAQPGDASIAVRRMRDDDRY